jgi:hypothetical protein
MKNSILILFFALLSSNLSKAQSPIIVDFRAIVKEIPNNFKTLQKDLNREDVENNYKIYTTTLEDSPICNSFVFDSPSDGTYLILSYKVADLDVMMLRIFNTMVPQYMNEINDMVKTGKYKGQDFEENGASVTEITDLNGKVILQYRSDTKEHRIMFYASSNK